MAREVDVVAPNRTAKSWRTDECGRIRGGRNDGRDRHTDSHDTGDEDDEKQIIAIKGAG